MKRADMGEFSHRPTKPKTSSAFMAPLLAVKAAKDASYDQ